MGYLTQNKTNRTRKQAKYFSWFANQKFESCLRNHSLENRHETVLKTMYFATKTAIWLSERYKVFGSVAMYHQVLHCIEL